MDKKKLIIGTLILIFFASGIIIELQGENLKMYVNEDKTTFYVNGSGWWGEVGGREINSLWDGATKMNRDLSGIRINQSHNNETNLTIITRYTPYQRGPVIIDRYTFDGSVNDVELFPVSHEVSILNGNICDGRGCIYQYEVRDLEYSGETREAKSPEEFGKNMVVEWEEGAYYQKVFQQIVSDKLVVRYRVNGPNATFNVRLFDPPAPNISFESPTPANNSALIQDYLPVNASSPDADLENITITLTNSTGTLINESVSNSTPFFINFTDLDFDTYNVTAKATDNESLSNTTTRFITLNAFNASLCQNISKIQIIPDSSNYNITSGTLTQHNITAHNSSACGHTYSIALGCSDGCDLQAKINISLSSTFELYYNNILMNTTFQTLLENKTLGDYTFNVTGSFINATNSSDVWNDTFKVVE